MRVFCWSSRCALLLNQLRPRLAIWGFFSRNAMHGIVASVAPRALALSDQVAGPIAIFSF